MDATRARLVVDLAVQTCDRAYQTLETALGLAPDFPLKLATEDLALQLLIARATARLAGMHMVARGLGLDYSETQVEVGGNG